jgi:hypothetical protein
MTTLEMVRKIRQLKTETAALVVLEHALKKLLTAKKDAVADVPCNVGLCVTTLKKRLIEAFMNGYESGHNDTVESAYSDAEDRANDWHDEQVEANT